MLKIAGDFSHNNPRLHVHDFLLGIQHLLKVQNLQNFHYEIHHSIWVSVVVESSPRPSSSFDENIIQRQFLGGGFFSSKTPSRGGLFFKNPNPKIHSRGGFFLQKFCPKSILYVGEVKIIESKPTSRGDYHKKGFG